MQKKRYYIGIIILVFVSFFGVFMLIKDKSEELVISDDSIEMQEKDSNKDFANNFMLKDLNGSEVALSDFKGKNIIVNFWATWCEPCKDEMDDLQKIYEELKSDNFEVLAVNVSEDKETVKTFIDEGKYKFKVLLDEEGKTAFEYAVAIVPMTYVINKNGEIEGIFRQQVNYDTLKGIKTVLDNF